MGVALDPSSDNSTETGRTITNSATISATRLPREKRHLQRGEHVADHRHDRDFGDAFEFDRETEHRLRHIRMRFARIGRGGLDIFGIDGADRLARRHAATRAMFDAAHRDARREDR